MGGCGNAPGDLEACVRTVWSGLRPVAEDRARRFLGKVDEERARCRGGARAVEARRGPWVDWPAYWATGDAGSRAPGAAGAGVSSGRTARDRRRAHRSRVPAHRADPVQPVRQQRDVPALRAGARRRRRARAQGLARDAAAAGPIRAFAAVGGAGDQLCAGELIRSRTLTGICNDIRNPLMGSTGMPFARNVEFEATFPELGRDRARPQPPRRPPGPAQARSAGDQPPALHARAVGARTRCHEGRGLPGHSAAARCDYKKAPFFNVLAAFWIQFMTHDWFSHLEEGRNAPATMAVGLRDASGSTASSGR